MQSSLVKIKTQRSLLFFCLLIWTAIILLPILWAVISSFKTNQEFYELPWQLPAKAQWINYINAWKSAHIGHYFVNSILVTGLSLIFLLILSSTSSYCISRMSFKGRGFLESTYIACMFVPSMFYLIPKFILLNKLKLIDTHIGLVLVYSTHGMCLAVMILIGFFKTLPRALEEAAIIDGASHFRVFASIMFPLAKPGVITVITLSFLNVWNEYVNALVMLSTPEKYTIPVGLLNLMEIQQFRTDWGALFAGLIISMIPALVIYISCQKYITKGVAAGAVKG